MEQIVIFNTDLNGHHLEYLNHLYLEALNNKTKHYVFSIPQEFNQLKNTLDWPEANHIQFDFLEEDKLKKIKESSLFKQSYLKSRLLKQQIKKHKANKVFLIMLLQFLPFFPFIIANGKVKISGIVYLIYLYRWKTAPFKLKIMDVFKYLLLTKFKMFDTIYILNDLSSAVYLNKLYKSKKFKVLPDPFVQQTLQGINSRPIPLIEKDATVYFHFGALTERKGTLDILKAIKQLDMTKIEQPLCFIFAGKVHPEIKTEFYQLTEEINNKVQLIIYDEFCAYEFIGALCKLSNYFLIPYKNVLQSSGVIAYASYYKKPVVGPNEGLLGKLIRKYQLGFTIKNINQQSITTFIEENKELHKKVSHSYIEENSVSNFQKAIFSENI